MFAENQDCSNAGHQVISTSLAQEKPQLRPRGVVSEGAGGAIASPDFGRSQTKPTVNWVLGAGQSREDQTTQQPQQLPIHQQNTQQLTPQWYGASSMSSLQSNKSIRPALSNNYQIKSNLLSITLDNTKSKSFPANKKRSRKSKNETKMESIYPEYWPDQRGKDGHLCCYYCGIQSHERSICYTLRKDILENGSDYRAFHPLRGHSFKQAKKKNSENKPSSMKLDLNQGQGSPESGHLKIPGHLEPDMMSVLGLQGGASSMSSLQSMKCIEPAPSNTHQIKSHLSPLDTIQSKSIASLFLPL